MRKRKLRRALKLVKNKIEAVKQTRDEKTSEDRPRLEATQVNPLSTETRGGEPISVSQLHRLVPGI